MKSRVLFAVAGFAVVVAVGLAAGSLVATPASVPAGSEAVLNKVTSASLSSGQSSLLKGGEPVKLEKVMAFDEADTPLPPAYIVLVSAVVGIAVLGSRRHRKKAKRQRHVPAGGLPSRFVL